MDVMEKLVELIESARYWGCGTSEETANNLIANGVTVQDNTEIRDELLERLRNAPITVITEETSGEVVQEWIPFSVPPKEKGCYFVTVKHWFDGNPVAREAYWNGSDWISCEKRQEITPRVTHWMPLPEPPKEDA